MICLAIKREKSSHCHLVLSVSHLGALGSRKELMIFLLEAVVRLLFSLKYVRA